MRGIITILSLLLLSSCTSSINPGTKIPCVTHCVTMIKSGLKSKPKAYDDSIVEVTCNIKCSHQVVKESE
jgi:hypothetical protein